MSCNTQEILLYLEGELAPEDAARVRAHVAACAACRELLLAEQELERSLSGLGEVEPPKDFADATVARARCDLTSAVASPRERRRAAAVVASLSATSLLLLWPLGLLDSTLRALAPLRCLSRFAACWLEGSAVGTFIVARTVARHVLDEGRLPGAVILLALLIALLVRLLGLYRERVASRRDLAK